jgi:hypothetical protein
MLKNPNRQLIKFGSKGGLAMTIPADWARENLLAEGRMVKLREIRGGLHLSIVASKAENGQTSVQTRDNVRTETKAALGGIQ